MSNFSRSTQLGYEPISCVFLSFPLSLSCRSGCAGHSQGLIGTPGIVWVPGVACLGGEGRQGCDLSLQVSPQHLLTAMVSEHVLTRSTDGLGDFCWCQELTIVATSSNATFPSISILVLGTQQGARAGIVCLHHFPFLCFAHPSGGGGSND